MWSVSGWRSLAVLFALPLGYATRYRRWGTLYLHYYRRRRAADLEYEDSWGVLADGMWVTRLIAIVWFVLALVF